MNSILITEESCRSATFLDWKVAIEAGHTTTKGTSNCKLIEMFMMSGSKKRRKNICWTEKENHLTEEDRNENRIGSRLQLPVSLVDMCK